MKTIKKIRITFTLFSTVLFTTQGSSVQAQCAPHPRVPLAWYRAEHNARDSAGQSHGELRNGASFVEGIVGVGFALDGVDDYIEVPDSPALDLTDSLTVEAWIRPLAFPEAATIVSQYDTAQDQASWHMILRPGGRLEFAVHVGGVTHVGRVVQTADPVITLGEPQHVAATVDLVVQTIRLYVHGNELVTRTLFREVVPTFFPSTSPVRIGAFRERRGNLIGWYNGLIDELTLYRSVLTSFEIESIYRAGSAGKCRLFPLLDIRVSQVELCWTTVSDANVWYQLQYRALLQPDPWRPITPWLPGNGSRFCTNDTDLLDQPHRFYRVITTNSVTQP